MTRRTFILPLSLLFGIPTMAQRWICQLYTGEGYQTADEWIEEHCTMRCREFLQAEYCDEYETDVAAYATWILYGDIEGEDKRIFFSSVESLGRKGRYTERKAVHLDVFNPEELAPAFRRTIVLDMVEEDGTEMVDSVEYPRDGSGMLCQKEVKRKAQKLPKELTPALQSIQEGLLMHTYGECMGEMPEVAHCMDITRHTMEPAVGQTTKCIQMHAIPGDDAATGRLRCIKSQTYHPEAESLVTTYETIVYSDKDSSPLCHFSTSTADVDGQSLTLEQTFYYSAEGRMLHATRHLTDHEGKEHPIHSNIAISDGSKEWLQAIRLREAFQSLE